MNLAGLDMNLIVALQALLAERNAQAPHATMVFRQPSEVLMNDPAGPLSTVDGLLMPHGIVAGLPAVDLFADRPRRRPPLATGMARAVGARIGTAG